MPESRSDRIQGRTGDWEIVIGLEVHAQVISESKLFSGAATRFGAEPNSQVSLVDAAMPGMLPVLNGFSVEQAVKTGLGLNAKINLTSVFERKNFFYPDNPSNYQISQYLQPIVGSGMITIDLDGGESRVIGITRLHLEQDAGKSLHDQHPSMTYVDLNRAGVALMEIVSEPDMRSAEEAAAYVTKLRSILRYLGTCDGNMEEGSLRCDVNLSVRRPGAPLGTRTETKNVNSIRFVKQAIEYEAKRQVKVLEDGGAIVQETRLFDADKGVTRSMRTKEEAHDYRYFPDPDLLPLVLDPDWVEELRQALPELPDARKARFMADFGFSAYDAGVIVAEREHAEWFEEAERERVQELKANREPKTFQTFVSSSTQEILGITPDDGVTVEEISASARSNLHIIIGPVFSYLNREGISINQCPITPAHVAGLTELKDEGVISDRIAKEVFDEMWASGKPAAEIVEDKGLRQISDEGAIEVIVEQVIADNPKQVAQFKSGNEKLIGWFVGQVMKASQGKANPALVNRILKDKLS